MRQGGTVLLFVFLLFCHKVFSQASPDTAKKKSYEELQQVIDNSYDTIYLKPYLNAYIQKAKKDNDPEKIYRAYQNYIYSSAAQLMLPYADSLISIAKKIGTNEKLGKAYEHKATVYYTQKNYKEAMDNFLAANEYASKTTDESLKHQIKYDIANIKFYLGFYKEALVLFEQCAAFFDKTANRGYINSMNSIALCYNKMGKYDLCTVANNKALERAIKTNDKSSIAYISFYEGINEYGKKNYAEAIKKINAGLPEVNANDDFANETVAAFYLGKSYRALGNNEKAMAYFKKTDEAFRTKKYTRPDLRENYEILINEAKKTGNIQMQLYYVDRLMEVDSVLNANYKYLSGKVYKEYDTKALIAEKKSIEDELANRKALMVLLYSAVGLLVTAMLLLMYRYFKHQKKYKERFEELMARLEHQQKKAANIADGIAVKPEAIAETTAETRQAPDINPEVVKSVLDQLEKFEAKNKFLKKELTLNDLAAVLNTNANYLSKIINYYKEKSFSNYLNDLRVDFIIELLRNQPRYRNFTIKALAEEAGFANAQHFSKAFYARTGLYPSFFVNEMVNVYTNAVVSE